MPKDTKVTRAKYIFKNKSDESRVIEIKQS